MKDYHTTNTRHAKLGSNVYVSLCINMPFTEKRLQVTAILFSFPRSSANRGWALVDRSCPAFGADHYSPVDASDAICPLGSSPTIEARLMDVISASCLTPNYFFILSIELHKADRAIAFNRLPLASWISLFRFNRSFLKYLVKFLSRNQFPIPFNESLTIDQTVYSQI